MALRNWLFYPHSPEDSPTPALLRLQASKDFKELFFATDRATRKYSNLHEDPQVAMLIDSRSNRESDLDEASAATALGRAREIQGNERDRCLKLYLAKHSSLEGFAMSSTSAFIQIEVESYILVSRFREVTELHP